MFTFKKWPSWCKFLERYMHRYAWSKLHFTSLLVWLHSDILNYIWTLLRLSLPRAHYTVVPEFSFLDEDRTSTIIFSNCPKHYFSKPMGNGGWGGGGVGGWRARWLTFQTTISTIYLQLWVFHTLLLLKLFRLQTLLAESGWTLL